MAIPVRTEINMTMAREASNFQNKNAMDVGDAFCTENMATATIIIKAGIKVPTGFLLLFSQCFLSPRRIDGGLKKISPECPCCGSHKDILWEGTGGVKS